MLEYLGQVAQWSWYGALVPPRFAAASLAGGKPGKLAFVIPISWASSYAVDWVNTATNNKSSGYATVHLLLGCLFLLASVVVLRRLPRGELSEGQAQPDHEILPSPNASPRFAIGRIGRSCCFAAGSRSLTASRNRRSFLWTKDVLGFSLLTNNIFRTLMQVGQLSLSVALGKYYDKIAIVAR